MNPIINKTLIGGLRTLDWMGLWVGLLSLRLLMAWEFGEAGWEKWTGENWFADIQSQFPWPFNVLHPDISWAMATGFEVFGALALVIGLGTRFFAFSLIILSVVAALAVHWPESWSTWGELMMGYAISDNGYGNFKLPVLFIGMLLPLVFMGPGRLSIDYWLQKRLESKPNTP
jgi:putative oxidoreductase